MPRSLAPVTVEATEGWDPLINLDKVQRHEDFLDLRYKSGHVTICDASQGGYGIIVTEWSPSHSLPAQVAQIPVGHELEEQTIDLELYTEQPPSQTCVCCVVQ
jgi:hypothetical protein